MSMIKIYRSSEADGGLAWLRNGMIANGATDGVHWLCPLLRIDYLPGFYQRVTLVGANRRGERKIRLSDKVRFGYNRISTGFGFDSGFHCPSPNEAYVSMELDEATGGIDKYRMYFDQIEVIDSEGVAVPITVQIDLTATADGDYTLRLCKYVKGSRHGISTAIGPIDGHVFDATDAGTLIDSVMQLNTVEISLLPTDVELNARLQAGIKFTDQWSELGAALGPSPRPYSVGKFEYVLLKVFLSSLCHLSIGPVVPGMLYKRLRAYITEGIRSIEEVIDRTIEAQEDQAAFGYDYRSAMDAVPKLIEEAYEVQGALQTDIRNQVPVSKETIGEIGDVLFNVVTLCRILKLDMATALTATTRKFEARQEVVAKWFESAGIHPKSADASEWRMAWAAAKARHP